MGKVEGSSEIKSLAELTDEEKHKFEFVNYQLQFELVFDKTASFDLNFAKSLENSLANVATYGDVSVTCDARITCKLDVMFENEAIDDKTKLIDLFGSSYDTKNDIYYESQDVNEVKFDGSNVIVDGSTFKSAFQFKVGNETVLVQANSALNGSSFKFVSYDVASDSYSTISNPKSSIKCIDAIDGSIRVVVLADDVFDIESSGKADAFAELKLINTVPQTYYAETINSTTKTISIKLKAVNGTSGVTGSMLNIDVDKVKAYANDLYDRYLSTSSDWFDCLDAYLSLQQTNDDRLGLGSSIQTGRSIKNTFGLYVLAADSSQIQFGCDPSLIRDYKTERGDGGKILIKSLYYTLDNLNSKHMRVSGALTASGAVGTEDGSLLEMFSIDASGDAAYECSWKESMDSLDDSVAMETQFEKKGNVFIAKENDQACWRLDYSNLETLVLEKYQIVGRKLTNVEKINLATILKTSYSVEEEANKDVNDLNAELVKYVGNDQAFSVTTEADGSSGFKVKIDAHKTAIYRVVTSGKFMSVEADGKTVHVDTENCADLAALSRAIKECLEINGVGDDVIDSVDRIGSKIVFSVVGNKTIKCNDLNIDSSVPCAGLKDDFVVGGVSIDFEDLDVKDAGATTTHKLSTDDTVEAIVEAINEILLSSSTGISLYYHDPDDEKGWDHLEFRSTTAFTLNNLYSSTILGKLGFTEKTSSKYGASDYRIVGKALLGSDWSKLIKISDGSNVEMEADFTLNIGDAFTATSVSAGTETIVINIGNTGDLPSFVEGGYIRNGDSCFKITKLNKKDDTGVLESVEVSNTPISIGATAADWTKLSLTYVAGINATADFIDVDLVVTGSIGAKATFTASKGAAWKETDSFLNGFDIVPNLDITGSNEFKVGGLVTGLTPVAIDLGTNSMSLVIDKTTNLPQINFDSTGITNALSSFKLDSFSIQNVYALLDGLVDRLMEIAKSYTSVKIPVINRSVDDLVNVANDIRNIVSKLRNDNIVSLQGLSDSLNKYLVDAKLVAKNSASKMFNITAAGSVISFDFDVSKAFSSVHDFSFGGATAGISGSAKLNVTGDLWFKLSAQLNTAKGYDFVLKNAVQFGSNIKILGEKLSFNLGVNGDNNLLKELITVGSNKNDALVLGHAAFTGSFGQTNLSIIKWELPEDPITGETPVIPLTFSLPMVIYGKLPISVKGYELGYIEFGKYNGSEIASVDTLENAALMIETRDAAVNTIVEKKATDSTTDLVPLEIKLITNEAGFEGLTGDNLVIDFSSVYENLSKLLSGDIDWFNKIRLAVTGLNSLLDSLESSINGGLMSSIKDVPVAGSALSNGVDFLSKLKEQVLEPFSDFVYESTGLTAEMVAQKMAVLFKGYSKKNDDVYGKLNVTDSGWECLEGSDSVFYKQNSTSAEWFFTLGNNYSIGKNLGLDLGLPGLGLETEAGLNLDLDWTLNFGMKVSKEGGFEFIFSDQSDVQVTVNADLSGDVKGKLAGLGVQLKFTEEKSTHTEASSLDSGVHLGFAVDLDGRTGNDSDISSANLQSASFSKIISGIPQFNLDAYVNMLVKMTVGVGSDVSEDTPKFPEITGDFDFYWKKNEGIKKLGFDNFDLNMGSFISGVLGPIVSKIQKVVEPLKPLVDFLTTPFPVLDDLGIVITPLDLAKEYSRGKFDDSMVYALKDLIALSEKITAFNNSSGESLTISLGSMDLIGGLGYSETAKEFASGLKSLKDLDVKSYLNGSDNAGKDAAAKLSENGFKVGDGSWSFIWDNPTDVFKLLLGQDIDLVHYNMPKLSFDFDWDTFVRIWGPLGARIGVSFNASIDLAFGYDTLGIRQWVGSDYKDYGRLLNGFYVDDLDAKGYDKNELSFYGGLTAAAELNAGVSAGVGGGVGINVGFNLFDPNKDGKIRLNEIEQLFKNDGLFGFFDVNGAITAKLYAYVDLLFYTKKWNITDDITLFEFNYEHHLSPVMISKSGDDVVANIGSNASSRVSTDNVDYGVI